MFDSKQNIYNTITIYYKTLYNYRDLLFLLLDLLETKAKKKSHLGKQSEKNQASLSKSCFYTLKSLIMHCKSQIISFHIQNNCILCKKLSFPDLLCKFSINNKHWSDEAK